jgi:hypothetical protein
MNGLGGSLGDISGMTADSLGGNALMAPLADDDALLGSDSDEDSPISEFFVHMQVVLNRLGH